LSHDYSRNFKFSSTLLFVVRQISWFFWILKELGVGLDNYGEEIDVIKEKNQVQKRKQIGIWSLFLILGGILKKIVSQHLKMMEDWHCQAYWLPTQKTAWERIYLDCAVSSFEEEKIENLKVYLKEFHFQNFQLPDFHFQNSQLTNFHFQIFWWFLDFFILFSISISKKVTVVWRFLLRWWPSLADNQIFQRSKIDIQFIFPIWTLLIGSLSLTPLLPLKWIFVKNGKVQDPLKIVRCCFSGFWILYSYCR